MAGCHLAAPSLLYRITDVCIAVGPCISICVPSSWGNCSNAGRRHLILFPGVPIASPLISSHLEIPRQPVTGTDISAEAKDTVKRRLGVTSSTPTLSACPNEKVLFSWIDLKHDLPPPSLLLPLLSRHDLQHWAL